MPLFIAALEGHIPVAQYLVPQGADIADMSKATNSSATPMQTALTLDYVKEAAYLRANDAT